MVDPATSNLVLSGVATAAAGLGACAIVWAAMDVVRRVHAGARARWHEELELRAGRQALARALGRHFGPVLRGSDLLQTLRGKIDRWMTEAGRPLGDLDASEVMALDLARAAFSTAVLSMAILLAAALAGGGWILTAPGVIFVLALTLMFSVSVAILSRREQARVTTLAISREFPLYLDIALLVVEAGGTPHDGMRAYVEAQPDTPLGRELTITLRRAEISSFGEALVAMAGRIGAEQASMALRNLAQSERSSGEVSVFYAEQAELLRALRSDLAERTAESLKVRSSGPTTVMAVAIMAICISAALPALMGFGG